MTIDELLKSVRERLTEDEGGWDFYDDYIYEARQDLKLLVKMLTEEGR